MNKSVSHYISELLILHDCVIIPGFGGFVGNRKSAQLNRTTGALTPPSKQILFNKNLKTNDGLLISHIASQENITVERAKKNVTNFSSKSNEQLSKSKVLRLGKIGLFTIGEEGNTNFLQDSSTNYSLDAFGMKTTHHKTIKNKIKTENKAEGVIQNIKKTNRTPKALLRIAAVMIPLIALSYLSLSQQESINTVYTQMASLNPFSTSDVIAEISKENPSEKVLINVVAELIETPVAEETTTPVIRKNYTYYIIAGAFAKQTNANRMLNKLHRWNYNAEIVEGNKLLRVSYDSFSNKDEAVLALIKIKQANPDAWLLTK